MPPEFTGGRKPKVNGKGGLLWTVRSKKSLALLSSASPKPGHKVSPTPENGLLTVHKTHYDKQDLYSSAGTGVQLHPAPEFPLKHPHFSCPTKQSYCMPLSCGRADEYGGIYLYYPICEVADLLHCGWQKAVNTLRELQYAELIDIKKQGCGKPNCIYPKSYEAVSNADFKTSGFGTPEV